MFGHFGKICSIKSSSFSVPISNSPSRKRSATSGKYQRKASLIVFRLHMNIPLFHRKSPLSRNTFAISRFGFSVKVFTG